jgi:hypothetical protein
MPMIKYKEIDAATDMAIATSGFPYTYYNRIIHSTSSPYSIDTVRSKTYSDPAGNSNSRLHALYIIDVEHALSLINNFAT